MKLHCLPLCFLSGVVTCVGAEAAQPPSLPEPAVPVAADAAAKPAADWIRAGLNTNVAAWGLRNGLRWGLPAGRRSFDGPRGLIRVRYPVLANGEYDLINFIAVEPVVGPHKGFSELERSTLDGVAGKRLWAIHPGAPEQLDNQLVAGQITQLDSGVQSLTVRVGVERFENGAHVTLIVTQRSDSPDELELAIHAQPDSAPIDYCILTATMGNKARARQLWLKDEVASSLTLYPNFRQFEFAPHRFFALDRLHRTAAGDVLVAITTDETNPAAVEPFPGLPHWRYAGFPVTQYWKKPAGTWRDDLHVAVNGRYAYWLSRQPIPGGIAFENFELRERFSDGQRFVFGITRKTPGELGFAALGR